MSAHHDTSASTDAHDAAASARAGSPTVAPRDGGARGVRLPSIRVAALLASLTLGAGIAIGAAIGPAPEASLAGSSAVVNSLPALLAGLSARNASQAAAEAAQAQAQAAAEEPAVTRRRRRRLHRPGAASAPAQTTATQTSPSETSAPATKRKQGTAASKLPPITSVWLIELAGTSFSEALADPSAAPYITGELVPKSTLLSGWSALEGGTFANDAALAPKRPTLGAAPPVLHTFVEPACPEGAPCSSGAGQLAAADEFAKAAVAAITATTTYAEHGLVVVTFTTVSSATAAELPAGSASSALASEPPAGVALLSPYAAAGAKPAVTFKPSSPQRALEALLH